VQDPNRNMFDQIVYYNWKSVHKTDALSTEDDQLHTNIQMFHPNKETEGRIRQQIRRSSISCI